MRKASKALALLLAMLMIVTALPMSVFAEAAAPSEPAGKTMFDLVIDGNDKNDEDVSSATDMGEAPTGSAMYDGASPVGLKLDWDAWKVIFPDDDMTSNQDISFTLWRETAEEAVVSESEVEDASYSNPKKVSIISDDRTVKVLNVYPIPASENLLKEWLSLAYGGDGYKEHFEVDTVLLDALAAEHAGVAAPEKTFNADYAEILAKGYDVIFFGTSDGNGDLAPAEGQSYTRTFHDLSEGAYNAVDEFIKAGHGVLFGHDTVCSANHLDGESDDKYLGFKYFTEFADELGIVCLEGAKQKKALDDRQKQYEEALAKDPETKVTAGNEVTDKIKVVNTGLLTTYPFAISKNLTVPETHSLLQQVPSKSTATVWMQLQDSEGDGKYYLGSSYSSYLLTNNNVAMIQTGHSSNNLNIAESAHKQEGQVIANTLFYLMQKSIGDYSTDGNFVDKEPPVIDDEASVSLTDFAPTDGTKPQYFYADIEISASDLGTAYQYYVDASRDDKVVMSSNKIQALAVSNLKGYMVVINRKATEYGAKKMANAHINDQDETGTEILVDVKANGEPRSEVITFNTGDVETGKNGLKIVTGKPYYAHIVPVDNANNYGNEIIVEINFENLYTPEVDTKIEPVVSESDAVDESDRFEVVTSTDAEGNTVEEITSANYYPHNYKDKDGEDFLREDKAPQEDEEVNIKVTSTVDTGKRDDIIGVVTLVKWDGEKEDGTVERSYEGDDLVSVSNLESDLLTPSAIVYGKEFVEEITFDIDKIYVNPDDYDADGNYTVNVTWYVKGEDGKPTDEVVDSAEFDFTIVQPDYKVTFNYLTPAAKNTVAEVSEDQYVKYGDDAVVPSIDKLFVADGTSYQFKRWDNSHKNITEDTVINAKYTETDVTGSIPDLPEDEEEPSEPAKEPELERLGGETRIETAIEISKRGWDKAKVVILATANEFPDAMAGVPLAKAVDAPILLTVNGKKLEANVKAEIARLNPEKVYILGQTMAVNADIEAELDVLYEIERLGGKDRFGTAVEIGEEMEEVYDKKADAVYFVRSDLFPDALSVSSVAAIEHRPILYVSPAGKIDEPTTEYCKTIGTAATIIGGPDAVNAAGEFNVKSLFKSVERIYGRDRYATSVEVCLAKESLFTGTGTALATGKKFPDALTGGSFAAKNNIPVLLVNGSVSSELSVYLANRPIKTLFVFGGKLAVSDEVAYDALSYCPYLYY